MTRLLYSHIYIYMILVMMIGMMIMITTIYSPCIPPNWTVPIFFNPGLSDPGTLLCCGQSLGQDGGRIGGVSFHPFIAPRGPLLPALVWQPTGQGRWGSMGIPWDNPGGYSRVFPVTWCSFSRRSPLKGLTCTNLLVMNQLASGMILVGKGLQNSWGRFCPGEFREKKGPHHGPEKTIKNPCESRESQPGTQNGPRNEIDSGSFDMSCNPIFINKLKWQLHETWKIQPSQKLSWATRMGNRCGVEIIIQTVTLWWTNIAMENDHL